MSIESKQPSKQITQDKLLDDVREMMQTIVYGHPFNSYHLSGIIKLARKSNLDEKIAKVIINEIPFYHPWYGCMTIMNLENVISQLKPTETIYELLLQKASDAYNDDISTRYFVLSNIDYFYKYLQKYSNDKKQPPSFAYILSELGQIERKILKFFKKLNNQNERVKTPDIARETGYQKGSIGPALSNLTNIFELLHNKPRIGYKITEKGRSLKL